MGERTCRVDGCGYPYRCSGYCNLHYRRFRRHGDPLASAYGEQSRSGKTCSVLDCLSPVEARGVCALHYQRFRRTGDPTKTRDPLRDPDVRAATVAEEERTGRRTCSRCQESLPIDVFPPRHGQRSSVCRPCRRARALEVEDADARAAAARDSYLLRNYGISQAVYASIAAEQNQACGICEAERALVVDHDHATGRTRGLICNDCNLALGHVRDSLHVLERLIDYVKTDGWGRFPPA